MLLVLGLATGFTTACEKEDPEPEPPQTEVPDTPGNEENDDNTDNEGNENEGNEDENEDEDNTGNEDPEEPTPAAGKTLIVYYSFTNNIHTVATDLNTQIEADILRVEPKEKGVDYAANNYAIGSAWIGKIRENPDDPASYPEIDEVQVNLEDYSTVFVAAPLWWSQMAAPMQTFLFQYGNQLAGRKIGLIVSSASSSISGVESDAHRLIPEGDFMTPSLWIRSSQTSNCHSLLESWLVQIGFTAE
ncbi:MAG: flavodoxin [Bacteroides sp.]|nr:flavodoxin [Bacteroides sp.]MCM1085461.1 flavodoxin [Bacteroides sp.]